MVRVFAVAVVLFCAQPIVMTVCRAAVPTAETFGTLDTVPDRLEACSTASAMDTNEDLEPVIRALQKDIVCLTGLANEIALVFYPPDAFGQGRGASVGQGRGASMKTALDQANGDLLPIFMGLQTRPLACDPDCDRFYTLQAYDMNVRFLNTLILDMTERLKDDSPVHTE